MSLVLEVYSPGIIRGISLWGYSFRYDIDVKLINTVDVSFYKAINTFWVTEYIMERCSFYRGNVSYLIRQKCHWQMIQSLSNVCFGTFMSWALEKCHNIIWTVHFLQIGYFKFKKCRTSFSFLWMLNTFSMSETCKEDLKKLKNKTVYKIVWNSLNYTWILQ